MQTKNKENSTSLFEVIKSGKRIEIFVLILFAISYIVVTIFHEPWFDESQAWQIARCASLKDILFTVPHYEGHPPLWHLLLVIPARCGLPYEITIKTIGLILSGFGIYLLLFKSPFPRWLKCLLPFNFFFFYQYSISVRPYSLMLIFCLLSAITFKARNEKPWRFVLCLIGLSFSSAYGLLISGGIAIAWCIDLISELTMVGFIKSLFKDKRFATLWMLLGCALFIVWDIRSYSTTFAADTVASNSAIARIVCALFAFIPDSLITENVWSSCEANIKTVEFDIIALVLTSVLGVLMWIIIWLCSEKKIFKYLCIPYILFAIFSALVYFNSHHIGIVLFMFMMWLWINIESGNATDRVKRIYNKLCKNKELKKVIDSNMSTIKRGLVFGSVLVLLLSVYWSVQSSILEVKYQYCCGRETANFIKEYNLDELIIFSEWNEKDTDGDGVIDFIDTNYMHSPVYFYPYFEEQIVANMKVGYATHIYASKEESQADIGAWSKLGVPDILVGYVNVSEVTGAEYTMLDYVPVFKMEQNFIWRGAENPAYNYIFARKDIVEKYNLPNLYDEIGISE